MAKWKKGWKILRLENGKRISCCNDGHAVYYEKDRIIGKPKKCGPLAVFATRDAAVRFLRVHGWWPLKGPKVERVIIRCLYIKSKYKTLWRPKINLGFGDGGRHILWVLPPRTILAEKMKCLE